MERSSRWDRWLAYLVVFLSYCYFIGSAVFFFLMYIENIIFIDDAFYFVKIARNFAAGHGFSFDGINQTNGFQPLWLYMLLPLAYAGQALSPEAFYRVVLAYQALIVLIAMTLINLALARKQVPLILIALVDALLVALQRPVRWVSGMETCVVLLIFALMLYWLSRQSAFPTLSRTGYMVLGLLMGLLMLARLDSVFVIACATLMLFSITKSSVPAKAMNVAVFLVGFLMVVSPYLIYNKLIFGDFMPISGILKNSFPYLVEVDFSSRRIPTRHYIPIALGLTYLVFFYRHIRDSLHFLLISSWLGNFLHLLHTGLWMRWGVFTWHFALHWASMALTLPLLINRLADFRLEKTRFEAACAVVSILLLISAYLKFPYRIDSREWITTAYHAALWVREHTEKDAVFAMKDAGVFGYFSQRRVINLDGLVNNKEYQEALKNKKLAHYLREKNVKYLVQHYIGRQEDKNFKIINFKDFLKDFEQKKYNKIVVMYPSQLYHTYSDPITLYAENEVYRSASLDGFFVIWQLNLNADPSSHAAKKQSRKGR